VEQLPRSPWHEGERAQAAQRRLRRQAGNGGHLPLRDHLIDQHRQFYPQLPFIVAGAVDREGDAWATILAGEPGFLQSPDPYHLGIAAARDPHDPADGGMNDGDAVGLLGIELHTRRRNRLNGLLLRTNAQAFDVAVQQSFGNCPQYIQLRDFVFARDPAAPSDEAPSELDRLDDRARAVVAGADTFFVVLCRRRGTRPGGRRLTPRRPAGICARRC
jgi:predicted pyridoxine 5'-phosphate oxidase superfamily flavin-nucleotide-binding protein